MDAESTTLAVLSAQISGGAALSHAPGDDAISVEFG